MARGRPRKQKNAEPETEVMEGQGPGSGHNGPEPLTDEEQRALAYHHKRSYQATLAKKKEADAAFKNAAKLAKSEGVSVDTIKLLIDLDSEEGQAKVEAEIQERYKAARWAGMPIGAQEDLFNTARMPGIEKAERAGETAALNGDDCSPISHGFEEGSEFGQAFIRGWTKGRDTMLSMLKKRETPAPILDADEAFPEEGDDETGIPEDEWNAAAPPPAPPTAADDPDAPGFLRHPSPARETEVA